MKKLFLAVSTACIASLSQAGVVAADPNGDDNKSVFLDEKNGLYWTTGKGLFSNQTQSNASATVSNASFEGLTWRLPTIAEFQNLYVTQGNEPGGKMNYGSLHFEQIYYWTSTEKNNLHMAFAVNYSPSDPVFDQSKAYADYIKLGVIAVSPVSEPETYAMLLAGLGLIGLTKRRKKV